MNKIHLVEFIQDYKTEMTIDSLARGLKEALTPEEYALLIERL